MIIISINQNIEINNESFDLGVSIQAIGRSIETIGSRKVTKFTKQGKEY